MLPNGLEHVTEDRLLDGRLLLKQPASGYRVGIDPVFLAAAVQARDGETVLDVGTGAGAAALCLAARVAGVSIVGIDANRDMVRLASANAEANGVGNRMAFFTGDLLTPPIRLAPGSFDHVLANPPFLAKGTVREPPSPEKAAATVESAAELKDWVRFCALMVRHKGSVTMIHRADRLGDVIDAFTGQLGGLAILPLWPGGMDGKPAKRVIVSAHKGSEAPLSLLPGLTLHGRDGRFTAEAEQVLRAGGELAWQVPT